VSLLYLCIGGLVVGMALLGAITNIAFVGKGGITKALHAQHVRVRLVQVFSAWIC
jgi:hypothetical protein